MLHTSELLTMRIHISNRVDMDQRYFATLTIRRVDVSIECYTILTLYKSINKFQVYRFCGSDPEFALLKIQILMFTYAFLALKQ